MKNLFLKLVLTVSLGMGLSFAADAQTVGGGYSDLTVSRL